MIRFAMIGCGGHSTQSIFPSLRFADLRLVAACDLQEDLARRNAAWFGAERTYSDHRRMLEAEDLDAVGVVARPPDMVPIAIDVVESGRHVFMEKPPGITLDDALRLRDAARTAGCQVMVGFMKRHARAYVRAKEITEGEDFGVLRHLRLVYSHWRIAPLREHLTVMSTHPLDLARFFCGDIVGGSLYKRDIGDEVHVVTAMLEHSSKAVSQLSLDASEPRVQESVDLVGDSSLVQVRNLNRLTYLKRPDPAQMFDTDESMAALWYPEMTIPTAGHDSLVIQGYAGQLRSFAASIASGEPVSPSIDDGVEVMRLVEKIIDAPEGLSSFVLEQPWEPSAD